MYSKLSFTTARTAEKVACLILNWGRGQALHRTEKINVQFKDATTIVPEMPVRLYRKFWQHFEETKYTPFSKRIYQLTPPQNFFRELWPSGLFSDLTLEVAGTSFPLHREVLWVLSPYFNFQRTFEFVLWTYRHI
jgi:hypothetical protein